MPPQGQWALPGGFVDENEPLDKAAARELQEETSVSASDVYLIQVASCWPARMHACMHALAHLVHGVNMHRLRAAWYAPAQQVGAFGDPGRDPRGWCVSVAYAALLPSTMTATAAVGARASSTLLVFHGAASHGNDVGTGVRMTQRRRSGGM